MRKTIVASVLLFIVAAFSAPSFAADRYALIKLEGSVNPIVSEHVIKSIDKANEEKVRFIILQMDTPGGLMGSMREIIKSILSSDAPVVVFTAPKGAQAASAGGYIMLAAHIAAMAPGTEIGAMHPVSPFLNFGQKDEQGKSADGIMEKKVLNDTIAYGKSLAQKRRRNVDWTVRAIRDAISSTYLEAYRLGIVDIIAEDVDDLLVKLNGRRVDVNGTLVTISTANLSVLSFEMDWKERMLNFFADPQMVFLLFIIAVAGIGMEFKSPGLIVPGVIGAVALFLFLMAVRVLPINLAGLALIILAIVLFILELKIASYGLLTVGGIVSFIFGSMILFDSPLPGGRIPMRSIIAVVVFLLAFFFVVVRSVVLAHKSQVTTGMQGIVGETGVAIRDFDGNGKVFVHGEIWNATSEDAIKRDDGITVVGSKGMTLFVKKS
ncbi:MAG: nodulation protein NfeD [Spirochaetales bacterium]|nr:MAG: nodulation protein NfeD [Spirochaetales bacterium]